MNAAQNSTARSEAPNPLDKKGNIIAIASGKGGVGKTWFSITFSHALARRNQRVLLFDADLGLANVDIQLGLMPERDLGGVISGRLSLSQAKVHFDDGDFDVLAGRSGSGGLAALPPNRLNTLGSDLLELSSSYDRVIMDLGAGIDRTVRSLSSRAGTTVVLTNTEPTALTDAYAFIKISIQANPTADIRVVINNCASHAEGRKTYATLRKACDTFLKYEPALLGVIRHDAHVLRSIRNQTAILTRYPNCDAADDVSAVVNVLLEGR